MSFSGNPSVSRLATPQLYQQTSQSHGLGRRPSRLWRQVRVFFSSFSFEPFQLNPTTPFNPKRTPQAHAATTIRVSGTFYTCGSYRCPERFAWSTVTIYVTAYSVRTRVLEIHFWLVILRVTVPMLGTSSPCLGVRGSLIRSSIMSPRLDRGSFSPHRFLCVH